MPIKGLKGGVGTKALGYGLGAAEEETDPNFNQTVLLLHGDGSEGEGNTAALGSPNYKAFKDNSTSTHAIVVNGDAYGNDFSPYYYADGYWSNSFTADSLKVTTASDFDLSSNQEFSIEFFLNPSAINASWGIFFYANPNDNNFQISHDGSGNVDLRFAGSQIGTPFTLPLNTWSHLVITRDSSGYIRQFLDGVLKNYNQKTDAIDRDFVTIGDRNGGNHFLGYISNVRWVKDSIPTSYQTSETSTGTTVFTSTTAPLTTSSQGATSADVKLLTCQSNRFKDTSGNQTFTFNGTPKVSTNTPFTQSKTANVGSGFFDGTGDGLTTAGSSDFAFGTSDFTIETWAYPFGAGGTQVIIDTRYGNNNNTDNLSSMAWFGTQLGSYSDGNIVSGTDIDLIPNAWNHLAVQRISNTMYYSINGKVSSTTPTLSNNFNNTGAFPSIGGNVGLGASMYTGYLADVRIVNGTGVYGTSNFSVPTAPLTAVTNTKILTCQYSGAVRNVGFVDDSKYNHQIIRNGDTTMGTFSPFSLEEGYWSVSFDGSNDGIKFPNSSNFSFGTGAFTIEFWVFGNGDNNDQFILGAREAIGTMHITFGGHGGTTAGGLRYVGSSTISTTDLISDNSWHHGCIERDGSNNIVLYIDGVSKATGTDTTNYTSTSGEFRFGAGEYGGNFANVYFSNFRIVKGSNVYGGAFTPPTTPLTAVSNTQILICQSNKHVDNSSNGLTLTLLDKPRVLPFSPFATTRSYSKDAVGGSMFLDGSGDYIYAEGNSSKPFRVLSNSEFSIEFWYYRLTAGSVDVLISGDVLDKFQLAIDASNKLDVFMFGSRPVSSPTFPLATNPSYTNAWHHFVMTRENHDTKVRTFINGELVSITAANTGDADFDDLVIGHQGKGTNHPTHGYMAGVRFSNSSVPSAYQTTETSTGTQVFTPPTAPVTADTNTQLLLNFNNAGIIDHTMKNNLETEANTRVSGQQIKFGTGSIYFDGTDDKIVLPHQEYHQLGKGEFTVELFVYFTSTNQRQGFFGNDTGWYFQIYDGELEFALSTSAIIERSFSHSINQWYHLAATRDSSNDIRLFIDGTQQGAVVNSTADLRHASNNFHIGNIGPSTSRPFAGGYMDEIRITKGVARYTSNFTVPTKAFANR
jgi:hypothetical protein